MKSLEIVVEIYGMDHELTLTIMANLAATVRTGAVALMRRSPIPEADCPGRLHEQYKLPVPNRLGACVCLI